MTFSEFEKTLDRCQPYALVDEKGVETTHIGYLMGVEPGSTELPQMRKIAFFSPMPTITLPRIPARSSPWV